jgi:hypothetical protein
MSYMVYVEGRSHPCVVHNTVESALNEAEREGNCPENKMRMIYIAKIYMTGVPVTERQWNTFVSSK